MSDLHDRIASSFGRQRAMATLGVELSSVKEGEVELTLPFRLENTQQAGTLHAGVLTALLDSACGYAALTRMPPGREVVSVEFKVNLLAPGEGERFRAVGKVRRAGRTLTVCTGEAFALQGGQEVCIALMQATMFSVEGS